MSKDPILIESFKKNEDIHTRTATEVFGVEHKDVTSDLRRQAKAINFGIIYGMSPFGLSKELSITRKMAETYINMYFSRYPKIREYLDETVARAKKTRQARTLLGRVRNLPEINSSKVQVRQFAERTAINTPIQGTAADLLKLAMIKVEKDLKKHNLDAAMLLTVHDELVFEVPEDQMEKTREKVSGFHGIGDGPGCAPGGERGRRPGLGQRPLTMGRQGFKRRRVTNRPLGNLSYGRNRHPGN